MIAFDQKEVMFANIFFGKMTGYFSCLCQGDKIGRIEELYKVLVVHLLKPKYLNKLF